MAMVRATSGKFSGRVELPHCTLGGSPDVTHTLPYFYPGGCNIGRCAHRQEAGAVLAALDPDLWTLLAQSGFPLPGTCRRRPPCGRRATLRRGPGLWELGHPVPGAGVAPTRPAGRPMACPSI